LATAILFITVLRASTLGTEFVPKLSEGDIVLGIIRAPGTSIEESCRMNTRIEKALLDAFPDEVAEVWSRVGTPEVATDAGALEGTDVFIALRPRDQWKAARTQAGALGLRIFIRQNGRIPDLKPGAKRHGGRTAPVACQDN
jgi:cobalt-zinc-cadmium resistance protein CzcA